MALNPPLTMNGDPCRVEGEFFVMKRKGVEFEFKVENGSKYTGEGLVILTTARMVCINKKTNSLFKAFDIPLAFISNEKFEQPIFGSNYIKGTVKPLFNLLPGNTHFKIWFTEGGFGTYVPAVFNLISSIKKNNYKGIDNKLLNSISSGTFSKTAYVDPNDPSVIYLEQPEVQITNNNQIPNNVPNQQFNQQQINQQQFNQPQYNQPQYNQQQFNQQQFNQQQFNQQNFNQPQYNQPQYNQPQYNQQFNQPQNDQRLNQPQYNQQIPYQQNIGNQPQPNYGQFQEYNQQYNPNNYQQNNVPNYNNQFNNQNYNQNQVPYMTTSTQPVQVNNSSNMTTMIPAGQLNQNNQVGTNMSTNSQPIMMNQNQINYPNLDNNPSQGIQNIQQNIQPNNTQQQQQQPQPSNPKYFGFFGPELRKNN